MWGALRRDDFPRFLKVADPVGGMCGGGSVPPMPTQGHSVGGGNSYLTT